MNAMWNLASQAAPLLLGVVTIPILLRALGIERFGLLTIYWALLGYFTIFDFGLGRSLTKLVADRISSHDTDDLRALVWSALALMVGVGLVAAVVIWLGSPWLLSAVVRPPHMLRAEAQDSIALMCLGIPLVTVTAGFRGVLEAKQLFGSVASVRLVLGASTFAGPLLIIPFSHSLVGIVAVLLASRLVACAVSFVQCQIALEGMGPPILSTKNYGLLLRFGGWITISNIVTPLLIYFDRFVIAALESLVAVAYYATPYELAVRLSILPASVAGVLFPAFAAAQQATPTRVRGLFVRGMALTGAAWFCVCALIMPSARFLLTVWLGSDFAAHSTVVLQVLLLAAFFNGMAYIPFALIQGSGRPKLTAMVHLAEVPFYLGALFTMVHLAGITGAAVTAFLRALGDFMALLYLSGRQPNVGAMPAARIGLASVLGGLALVIDMLPFGQASLTAYAGLVLTTTLILCWRYGLSQHERANLVASGSRIVRRIRCWDTVDSICNRNKLK